MKQLIGKVMNYLEVGRNQVIGRVTGIIQLVLTFAIYLKVDGKELSVTTLIGATIVFIIILIFSGWAYMKFGLLKSEVSHRNMHSPELMEIHRYTKKTYEAIAHEKEKA